MLKLTLVVFASSLLFHGSISRADGGSTIPIPDEIKQPKSGITVSGEPGSGQAGVFKYVPLELDKKGQIKKEAVKNGWLTSSLNEELVLKPGPYLVNYGGTAAPVTLGVGEHRVIQLAKLNVPKVDGSYSIKIFQDLSNAEEQNRFLLLVWSGKQGVSATTFTTIHHRHRADDTSSFDEWITAEELCRARDLKKMGRGYCAAISSGNYKKLLNTIVFFHKDGTASGMNIAWNDEGGEISEGDEGLLPLDRYSAATCTDGDTVSVFPGVYGIEMTNFAGKSVTKLGIVAK
jgi:hypothetical protein